MTISIIKSLAKKNKVSVKDAEELWNKARTIAVKKLGADNYNGVFGYTVFLLKKMLKMKKEMLKTDSKALVEGYEDGGEKWRIRADHKNDSNKIFNRPAHLRRRKEREAERKKKQLKAQKKEANGGFPLEEMDSDFSLLDLYEDIERKPTGKIKDHGFWEEREETWRIEGDDSDPDGTTRFVAYAENGQYIGEPKRIRSLIKKFKISEFINNSLGFSEEDQKYYGWSHRAIFGFGIGDKLYEERFENKKNKQKIIKTLGDAKKSAINFARSVS